MSQTKLQSKATPQPKKAKISAPDCKEEVVQLSSHYPVIKEKSTKPRKQSKIITHEDDWSLSDENEESFHSSGSIRDEHREYDEHELRVQADLDDISSYGETDEEDEKNFEPADQQKWKDHYMSPPKNNREYFMSQFYKYLLHAVGGAHSEHQSLLYVRQVHIIMDALDAEGTDLSCFTNNSGLNISDPARENVP